MTEYVGIALVVIIGIAIYLSRPKETYKFLVGAVISRLQKSEPYLVQGLYNGLPAPIKEKVTSKDVAKIVEVLLTVIVNTISDENLDK